MLSALSSSILEEEEEKESRKENEAIGRRITVDCARNFSSVSNQKLYE
jgi:hypothetical protein